MRVLFTFVGGPGHLLPLVPIARAVAAAGHVVAFAGSGSMTQAIETCGFRAFATEPASTGVRPRRPLPKLDNERAAWELTEIFARSEAPRRAKAILELAREWEPDVIVGDEVDFGSMVAAERLSIPHAGVLVLAAGGLLRKEIVVEPLRELRDTYGLPSDPELAMLDSDLVLSPVPPSFRDPDFPLPATAHAIRTCDVTPRRPGRPDGPLVYFTLGTEFNTESGDLFSRVLAGLGQLPVTTVATVGVHVDPAELGPQPPNVRVRQYVPQGELLPTCDLVVSHGGSGTVIGALAHGVPCLLIPLGADQPHNAARCAALGAGEVFDPLSLTPETMRSAASAMLSDPRYRQAAEAVRREVADLPGPESAVPLLERLTKR
ncbi:nucleotide disphospho-sugar-binding domain-containing protein [Actinopolymorpha sp. NPDC004070]|uniref:glycosyltransferase n=1 Tax=Actinopolymorpha sp. NPDC004070 TaxID=3154548 RepID=UPI0033BCBB11